MSEQRFRQFLNDLRNPSLYVKVEGVNVFDEHDEEGKGGKVVRSFGRKELEHLARVNNERTRRGDLTPIVFGHTDPENPDEAEQPSPRGYAMNYRVEYDRPHGRWMLRADYYIRRPDHRDAQTYPFTSIELWPKEGIIQPISLLRRCPARDLGQWTYGRHPHGVLRYSMEFKMPERYEMEDEPVQNAMPDDLPDGPKPGESEGGGDGELSPEEHEQFMKHCYSHPLAARHYAAMCKKYAMDAEPADGPAPDPTEPPSADREPPVQNSYASATNGLPPARPAKHARDGEGIERFRKGGDQQLYKRIEELEAREARKEAENWVLRLADQEGFEMDESAEVERFAACYRKGGTEACSAHADHIRRFHRQKLTHRTGPVASQERPVRSPAGYDPSDPTTMPLEDQQKVYQYAKDNNIYDLPFAEIAARALPRKYGKQK